MDCTNLIDETKIRELFFNGHLRDEESFKLATQHMFKNMLETIVQAGMEEDLGYQKHDYSNKTIANSRNGSSKKSIKTDNFGKVELAIPRDREGEFESTLVPKYSRVLGGLEDRILSLYSRGLTVRDIEGHLKELYGVELSPSTISNITEKIFPLIKEWQQRPLPPVYSFMFLDAIHYNVRQDSAVVNKAAYVAIGITLEGKKEVLGLYIGENESSKYWLGVLNEIKNRGVKDVLIVSTDGLTGFKEAIQAVFPMCEIQRCVIHQIRNSIKHLNYKDTKEFLGDLKGVYKAASEEIGMNNLLEMKDKWGNKYKIALKSWEDNWDTVSTFYKYPEEIRRIMYTTNIIESLNRQYRKVTKSKSIFPTDNSLLKSLYLATVEVEKRWTSKMKDWNYILGQLVARFGDRITKYL